MNITATIMASAGILLLIWTVRKINPGSIFLSSLLGVGSLFAADLILGFTHQNLPVNPVTVLFAVMDGIPGVILMVILNSMLSA